MSASGAGPLPTDGERLRLLAGGVVLADAARCVQCGLCAWNCPMGVDTRAYARAGLPITDAACILCGSCVAHCPRGTLRLAVPEAAEAGTPSSAPAVRAA